MGCNARGELTVETKSCGGKPEGAACTEDLAGTVGIPSVDATVGIPEGDATVGGAGWLDRVFIPSGVAFDVIAAVDKLFLVSLGITSKLLIT